MILKRSQKNVVVKDRLYKMIYDVSTAVGIALESPYSDALIGNGLGTKSPVTAQMKKKITSSPFKNYKSN